MVGSLQLVVVLRNMRRQTNEVVYCLFPWDLMPGKQNNDGLSNLATSESPLTSSSPTCKLFRDSTAANAYQQYEAFRRGRPERTVVTIKEGSGSSFHSRRKGNNHGLSFSLRAKQHTSIRRGQLMQREL